MKLGFNKRAWEKGVRRYGKAKMILGVALAPIWVPVWVALMVVAFVLQLLGAAGELLERKIN